MLQMLIAFSFCDSVDEWYLLSVRVSSHVGYALGIDVLLLEECGQSAPLPFLGQCQWMSL